MNDGRVLHLKTQRDQPYGSVMVYGANAPPWTDDEKTYYASSVRCSVVTKEQQ